MAPDKRLSVREEIYDKLGKIAQTLGCASRLKIIHTLSQSPRSVEELSEATGESIANTSQHLQRLAREGLVTATRAGLTKLYRIKNDKIIGIWETLQDLAHEVAPELDANEAIIADPSLCADAPTENVLEKIQSEEAVLLDVRTPIEHSASPVNTAQSIPIEKLKEQIKNLNPKKPIYVFCRGKYCYNASDAVKMLRDAGFKAFRLKESSFALNRLLKKES